MHPPCPSFHPHPHKDTPPNTSTPKPQIPDAIKYSLHVLLVRHGKACRACSKGTLQLPEVGPCPLTALANGGKLRPAVVALAEELGVGGGKGAGEAGAGGGKSKKAKVIKKEV